MLSKSSLTLLSVQKPRQSHELIFKLSLNSQLCLSSYQMSMQYMHGYRGQHYKIFIAMFSCCSPCPKTSRKGDYAFEVFKKVPSAKSFLGSLTSFKKRIASHFSGMFGREQHQIEPVDMSKFTKNVPLQSLSAEKSNFHDLMSNNQGGVIRKVMKSNYEELLQEHAQSGQKYTDPDFPPDSSSIGYIKDLVENKVRFTWKRIPDVIRNGEFVSGTIEPSDIIQGRIGDCYFLSALAAIAEHDFRIKNIFPNLEINKYGIYMARVLYKGVITEVVVDDYVPVDVAGSPLFAKPAGGREIWVMLLEKCWAKLNGTYGDIVGGLPHEVLHAYTGAPTDYRSIPQTLDKQNGLWNEMWQAYQKGAILCCGTRGDDDVQRYGFVKGHAYTILNLYQTPYRMLKIRNPWGRLEWSGRASDKDRNFWATISPADQQHMGHSDKEDGIFFILWQDFVNYYDMVDICRVNDNASFTNLDSEFSRKNAEMFEFYSDGGTLTVELSQSAKRNQRAYVENRFAKSLLILARQEEAPEGYEYKYVDSSLSIQAEHNLELTNLPKGKYVIYAKYDWIYNDVDTAGVSIYSDSPALLEKSSQSDHKDFLYKVFLDHARNNPRKSSLGANDWMSIDFIDKCGYGYIVIHIDDHSNRRMGVMIDERLYNQKRLVLKKPYRGKGIIKTSVEPGKQVIVLYRLKTQANAVSFALPMPTIYNLI